METYAFVSDNSPRLVGMFKASMTRELAAQGKQFNVVDETPSQITFTGFDAACLADALVAKMRTIAFRGERLDLIVLEPTI